MAKFKIGKVVGGIGPQGVQGKSGTMKIGKVTTLQPGTSATVSNTGTTENAVLDFGIPRGDDGITDLVAEYRADWSHTCSPTVAAPVVIKEISGKTVQDGTPTPDNPVEIQGVGDSGRLVVIGQGKNLCPYIPNLDNIQYYETDLFPWTKKSNIYIKLNCKSNNANGHIEVGARYYDKSKNQLGGNGYEDAAGLNYIEKSISFNGRSANAGKDLDLTNVAYIKLSFLPHLTTAATISIKDVMVSDASLANVPYQPGHCTTTTIPLASPLYDGDKICCVQPGESYVDENGNRAVAHRVLWGVWRENGGVVFDGSADETWDFQSNYNNRASVTINNILHNSSWENAYGLTNYFKYNKNVYYDKSSNEVGYIVTDANFYIRFGSSSVINTVGKLREWLSSHNLIAVFPLAAPYFQPFPDQSPFHDLRTANDLTYIYTADPLKPEITVDVAKQAAGGYLLAGYMDRDDGIMVDHTTGAECVLGMEDGLLTVYEIEED